MQVKKISVPKKVSKFGSSTAIYLDVPTVAYLHILRDDDSFHPVCVSVEGSEELSKTPRYTGKGTVVITFTRMESEILGLVQDDVRLFTISV